MATLREIKDSGWRVTVHCEANLVGRICAHYTQPRIDQLIQYLGGDFDLVLQRNEFLSRFKCQRCGSKNATIRTVPPSGDGLMDGSGGAHHHSHMPSIEERAARAAAFEAEFRRMGFKTNAELAAESRAKIKAKKNAAKAGADFIGPPSPWAHRKRGKWL